MNEVISKGHLPMNADILKSKKLKVLAFFGSDLKGRETEFLQNKLNEGYVLLALDVPAIGLASKAGVPYTVIDDWIDPSSMDAVVETALYCERYWFESAREEFTVNGICWPDFDREAMHWFWLSVSLANTFTEDFLIRGGESLVVVQPALQQPAVYYSPSDVCSALWNAILTSKVTVLKSQGNPFWKRALRYAISKSCKIAPSSRWRKSYHHASNPSVLEEKVVLAFNPDEFHRFTPTVRQLLKSFHGGVAAAVLSPNQALTNEIAAKWSIPAVCRSSPEPVDFGLQHKFLRGLAKAVASAEGKPWQKPLKYLDFHFEHYCKQRWPTLVADFRFWCEVLNRWRPKAVIVSSSFDAESHLPTAAANQLGIPTFSIPHGGVMKERDLVSEYVLYSLNTQKITHERAGISANCLLPCADLFVKNEYAVSPLPLVTTKSEWRVLVITAGTGFRGCLIPNIGPRAQLTALHALANPPSDLAEKLRLAIKVHPNPEYSDLELFEAVGNHLKEHVLPINSDIHTVIDYFDLVVSVNNRGSSPIHAIQANKPIIHFLTDNNSARMGIYNCDIFFSSGMIARTPDELWKLVRGYFTDSGLAEQMRLKAQKFHRDNLDDSNYPPISEVISEVLSKT